MTDRSNFPEEMRAAAEEARGCLEKVRRGDPGGLVEMKQWWRRLKEAASARGVPAVLVLASALESLVEAWQRARSGGRDHPDAPRLIGEALDLLPALAAGEVSRGSGVLKDLCVRAGDLTRALEGPAAEMPE